MLFDADVQFADYLVLMVRLQCRGMLREFEKSNLLNGAAASGC